MKHILLLSLIFCSFRVAGQTSPRQLTTADSIKAKHYWYLANNVPLYSHQRDQYLDSALAIMPWNAYWWQQKANPTVKLRKYELAIQYLDSAVKYDRIAYFGYRAYTRCIHAKLYRQALSEFDEAILLNGRSGVMDHSYDFYKGLCHLQLNSFDSAYYYFSSSINAVVARLDESWVSPTEYFYLGIAEYERERWSHAIGHFDKALIIYPNFSDAKYYKALCLDKANSDKEALTLMLEAEADFRSGGTINEDAALYEQFPYQVCQRYFTNAIRRLSNSAVK